MSISKCIAIFFFFSFVSVRADEVKLVGTIYCPLICEGDNQGFMVDIAKAIYEKKGHTLNYKNYPRSRALELVEAGEADGLIGQIAGFNSDYIYPKEQSAVIALCFYTTKSNTWQYDGLTSLENVKLGLIRDYGYAAVPEAKEHIERFGDDPTKISYIVGEAPLLRIFQMMSLGRLSATIDDQNVANYLIQENQLGDIRMAGCPDTRINSYVIFPRINSNSETLANEFDAGIAELRASGELNRILEKYASKDWK